MEDLKASKKVKQNHLYCPLVAGCTVGLKSSPSMSRTWAQLKIQSTCQTHSSAAPAFCCLRAINSYVERKQLLLCLQCYHIPLLKVNDLHNTEQEL